jgi:hypothetical protein
LLNIAGVGGDEIKAGGFVQSAYIATRSLPCRHSGQDKRCGNLDQQIVLLAVNGQRAALQKQG